MAEPYAMPLPLLMYIAATIAMVWSARNWEAATGLSLWAWIGAALLPLIPAFIYYREHRGPVVFLRRARALW